MPYFSVGTSSYSFNVQLNGSQTTYGNGGWQAFGNIGGSLTAVLKPGITQTHGATGIKTTLNVVQESCNKVVVEWTLDNTASMSPATVGACLYADAYVVSDTQQWIALPGVHGIHPAANIPFFLQSEEPLTGFGSISGYSSQCLVTTTTPAASQDYFSMNWQGKTVAAGAVKVFKLEFSNYEGDYSTCPGECSDCSAAYGCYLEGTCYWNPWAAACVDSGTVGSCSVSDICPTCKSSSECVDKGCSWLPDIKTCISCSSSSCSSCDDSISCNTLDTDLCKWDGTFCVNSSSYCATSDCSSCNSASSCTNLDVACSWNPAGSFCFNSAVVVVCTDYTTQATCPSGDCYWSLTACLDHSENPSCSEDTCSECYSITECGDSAERSCVWSSGACGIQSMSCTGTPRMLLTSTTNTNRAFEVQLNGQRTTFSGGGYQPSVYINGAPTSNLKRDVTVTHAATGIKTTLRAYQEDCNNVVVEWNIDNSGGENGATVGACLYADFFVVSDNEAYTVLAGYHGMRPTASTSYYLHSEDPFSGFASGESCTSPSQTNPSGDYLSVNWQGHTVGAGETKVFRLRFSNYEPDYSTCAGGCSECSGSYGCLGLGCYWLDGACVDSEITASCSGSDACPVCKTLSECSDSTERTCTWSSGSGRCSSCSSSSCASCGDSLSCFNLKRNTCWYNGSFCINASSYCASSACSSCNSIESCTELGSPCGWSHSGSNCIDASCGGSTCTSCLTEDKCYMQSSLCYFAGSQCLNSSDVATCSSGLCGSCKSSAECDAASTDDVTCEWNLMTRTCTSCSTTCASCGDSVSCPAFDAICDWKAGPSSCVNRTSYCAEDVCSHCNTQASCTELNLGCVWSGWTSQSTSTSTSACSSTTCNSVTPRLMSMFLPYTSTFSFDLLVNGKKSCYSSQGFSVITTVNSVNTAVMKPYLPVTTASNVRTTFRITDEDCHTVSGEWTLENLGETPATVGACIWGDYDIPDDDAYYDAIPGNLGVEARGTPFFIQADQGQPFTGMFGGSYSSGSGSCNVVGNQIPTSSPPSAVVLNWQGVALPVGGTQTFKVTFSNYLTACENPDTPCSACDGFENNCYAKSAVCFYENNECIDSSGTPTCSAADDCSTCKSAYDCLNEGNNCDWDASVHACTCPPFTTGNNGVCVEDPCDSRTPIGGSCGGEDYGVCNYFADGGSCESICPTNYDSQSELVDGHVERWYCQAKSCTSRTPVGGSNCALPGDAAGACLKYGSACVNSCPAFTSDNAGVCEPIPCSSRTPISQACTDAALEDTCFYLSTGGTQTCVTACPEHFQAQTGTTQSCVLKTCANRTPSGSGCVVADDLTAGSYCYEYLGSCLTACPAHTIASVSGLTQICTLTPCSSRTPHTGSGALNGLCWTGIGDACFVNTSASQCVADCGSFAESSVTSTGVCSYTACESRTAVTVGGSLTCGSDLPCYYFSDYSLTGSSQCKLSCPTNYIAENQVVAGTPRYYCSQQTDCTLREPVSANCSLPGESSSCVVLNSESGSECVTSCPDHSVILNGVCTSAECSVRTPVGDSCGSDIECYYFSDGGSAPTCVQTCPGNYDPIEETIGITKRYYCKVKREPCDSASPCGNCITDTECSTLKTDCNWINNACQSNRLVINTSHCTGSTADCFFEVPRGEYVEILILINSGSFDLGSDVRFGHNANFELEGEDEGTSILDVKQSQVVFNFTLFNNGNLTISGCTLTRTTPSIATGSIIQVVGAGANSGTGKFTLVNTNVKYNYTLNDYSQPTIVVEAITFSFSGVSIQGGGSGNLRLHNAADVDGCASTTDHPALYLNRSSGIISNTVFSNINSGALYINGGNITLESVTFRSNIIPAYGQYTNLRHNVYASNATVILNGITSDVNSEGNSILFLSTAKGDRSNITFPKSVSLFHPARADKFSFEKVGAVTQGQFVGVFVPCAFVVNITHSSLKQTLPLVVDSPTTAHFELPSGTDYYPGDYTFQFVYEVGTNTPKPVDYKFTISSESLPSDNDKDDSSQSEAGNKWNGGLIAAIVIPIVVVVIAVIIAISIIVYRNSKKGADADEEEEGEEEEPQSRKRETSISRKPGQASSRNAETGHSGGSAYRPPVVRDQSPKAVAMNEEEDVEVEEVEEEAEDEVEMVEEEEVEEYKEEAKVEVEEDDGDVVEEIFEEL